MVEEIIRGSREQPASASAPAIAASMQTILIMVASEKDSLTKKTRLVIAGHMKESWRIGRAGPVTSRGMIV